MKASNAAILIAVVVIVAGVAWFRSAREESGTAGAPVQNGDLCPEPSPPTQPAEMQPATPTTNPAVARKLPRVVDLGADKCIPCKKLAPILEELKKEYDGRVIVDFIDVWKDPKAGEPYRIRVIPTQVFFDADGKEVWRHEGFLPKEDFVRKFAELGAK